MNRKMVRQQTASRRQFHGCFTNGAQKPEESSSKPEEKKEEKKEEPPLPQSGR